MPSRVWRDLYGRDGGELCCLLAGGAARADREGASRAAKMAVEWSASACGRGVAGSVNVAMIELWIRIERSLGCAFVW